MRSYKRGGWTVLKETHHSVASGFVVTVFKPRIIRSIISSRSASSDAPPQTPRIPRYRLPWPDTRAVAGYLISAPVGNPALRTPACGKNINCSPLAAKPPIESDHRPVRPEAQPFSDRGNSIFHHFVDRGRAPFDDFHPWTFRHRTNP